MQGARGKEGNQALPTSAHDTASVGTCFRISRRTLLRSSAGTAVVSAVGICTEQRVHAPLTRPRPHSSYVVGLTLAKGSYGATYRAERYCAGLYGVHCTDNGARDPQKDRSVAYMPTGGGRSKLP